MRLDSDIEILLKVAELGGLRVRRGSHWVEVISPNGVWAFYATNAELLDDLLADQLNSFIVHHAGKPKMRKLEDETP